MNKVYKVIEEFASDALINKEEYIKMYAESVNDPDSFWKKHAKRLNWIKLKNFHMLRMNLNATG